MQFRYAAASIRYAKMRIRYADAQLRYAIISFCYAGTVIAALTHQMTPFLSRFPGENGVFDILLKPAVSIADSHECMLRRVAPTSNTERQRQFRERNPGYYGRLHAKRRAESDAIAAQRLAMAKVTVEHREPLALPAPAILVDIPGMTTIPERRERSPVPIAIEEYALR